MAFPGLGFDFLIRIGKNAGVFGLGLFNTNDPNYRDKKHELIKLLQGDFSIVISFRGWILFVALTHGSREEAENASFWSGSSLNGKAGDALLENEPRPTVNVTPGRAAAGAAFVGAAASTGSARPSSGSSSVPPSTGTAKSVPGSMTPEMESAWADSTSDNDFDGGEQDTGFPGAEAMHAAWGSPEAAKTDAGPKNAGNSRKYEDEKGVPWGTRPAASSPASNSSKTSAPSSAVPGAEEEEVETETTEDFIEGLPDLKSLIRERKKRRFSA